MSRYVPPVFPPIPSPLPENPLDLLSDDHLINTQFALSLACGRSRSALRTRKRTYICFLDEILTAEIIARQIK